MWFKRALVWLTHSKEILNTCFDKWRASYITQLKSRWWVSNTQSSPVRPCSVTTASLMRPHLKNQCKSMVLCCSVHPDLTSLSAELRKSFTVIAVAMDKEHTLITEASTNWGKTAWPWTNEYIWKKIWLPQLVLFVESGSKHWSIWHLKAWPLISAQENTFLTKQCTIRNISRKNNLNAKHVIYFIQRLNKRT